MTSPESRYRRLLALYPRDFRREYEDEMLGVLLADPRPGPGKVLDLIRSGLAARVRAVLPGDGEWARAARVVQLFGAILLLGVSSGRVAWAIAWMTDSRSVFHFDTVDLMRVGGWSVVLVAAIYGVRAVAVAGAALGLAGEIAAPARYYLDTPATVLNMYWLIVASVVVLVAGAVSQRGSLRYVGLTRGLMSITLAGTALLLHGPMLRLYGSPVFGDFPRTPAYAALLLAAVALAAVGFARQEPAIRRRMVVWAVPILATVPLVQTGFADFMEYNSYHPESTRLIGPGQWAVLVLVPVAAFVVVAELNRRLEATRGFTGGRGGQVRAHE